MWNIQQPMGYEILGKEQLVYKFLEKTLYGLKQAPSA